MNDKTPSMRSLLGRARGLGSAKHGTEHWWLQRLTSLALIPLSIYLVGGFIIYAVLGGYSGAHEWLRGPVAATAMILFLAVGFHHSASGLQVVIEDYVHKEWPKLFGIVAVKFTCAVFALIGILAVLKILFGV